MPRFNGKAKLYDANDSVISMYSDASYYGYGAYHAGDWLAASYEGKKKSPILEAAVGHQVKPPPEHVVDNINVLELIPILEGVRRWGPAWRNRRICCVTDNTQVLYAIRTGRSKNKHSMAMLRDIFWILADYNFYLEIVYINTKDNKICDSLSRLNEPEAVNTLVKLMSVESLCCYEIFRRNGRVEAGSSRHHEDALRTSQRGSTCDTGKQVPRLLRGVRTGPHNLRQRESGLVHCVHGQNHEGIIDPRLSVGSESSLEVHGRDSNRLSELQGAYGHRGNKAQTGHGRKARSAASAASACHDVLTSNREQGTRDVSGRSTDVLPRSATETERDRLAGDVITQRHMHDVMGYDGVDTRLQDNPVWRPGAEDPHSAAVGPDTMCSVLDSATLQRNPGAPVISGVPEGAWCSTGVRNVYGHTEVCGRGSGSKSAGLLVT